MLDQVTAVIINWRTLQLTLQCIDGLLREYPELQLILVDNGSGDKVQSALHFMEIAKSRANTSAILNHSNWCDRGLPMPRVGLRYTAGSARRVFDVHGAIGKPFMAERVTRKLFTGGNVGHGPALHQVLKLCKTPYLLALDSDCVVQRGGFIERMLEPFSDSKVYAVGREVKLDRRGTAQPPRKSRKGNSHIHGSVILLDVAKYHTLKPFVHYGTITLFNMPDAIAQGYKLVDYNIGPGDTEVYHLFKGSRKLTASMPNVRSLPIMPGVLLDGLLSEFIGGYFDV